MSFLDLAVAYKYRSSENDIPREFLVPTLHEAAFYKRAIGYFSSSSLLYTSFGLCSLAQKGGKIQFVSSPELSEKDIEIINQGYEKREKMIEERMLSAIIEPRNYYEMERYNLLAHLIEDGILEFKIALTRESSSYNIYHEKIGILEDEEGNSIAFTGSLNESENAYYGNFESIDVYRSWISEGELVRVEDKKRDFECLWNNHTNKIEVFEFPVAVKNKLLSYKRSSLNLNIDKEELGLDKEKTYLSIPDGVILRDYQIEAQKRWFHNNYRGIYDMATGTGKTYTALASLAKLYEIYKDMAVFVVCPYIHLVDQWAEDVIAWGAEPIICHSNSEQRNWEERLARSYRGFKYKNKPFICVTTNVTFTSEKIQRVVKLIQSDMNVALVIDEAHNFGAENLSAYLNENFKVRLALSATIERYQDEVGTNKLLAYFGEKCIEYPLQKAIQDGALVEYYYFPVIVTLNENELQEYTRLSKLISKYIKKDEKKGGKIEVSEQGKMLLFQRSRLIAGAHNKLDVLKEYLSKYKEDSHILIYCGATKSFNNSDDDNTLRQIEEVQLLVGNELGMKTHKFTSEEDAKERKKIKEYFNKGVYQVITAIRCLDEGVNIPSIKTAFILASSRNPKEFIQRRGRLLRKSEGKNFAKIYDFITLPRALSEVTFWNKNSDIGLVKGELDRIREFAQFALNSSEGFKMIDRLMSVYEIDENVNTEDSIYDED